MAKKSDLDMQTFQIYQDEETNEPPIESKEDQKKKKFDFSFKKNKPHPDAVDSDDDEDEKPKGGMSDIVKGIALGVIIIAIFVVIDIVRK